MKVQNKVGKVQLLLPIITSVAESQFFEGAVSAHPSGENSVNSVAIEGMI